MHGIIREMSQAYHHSSTYAHAGSLQKWKSLHEDYKSTVATQEEKWKSLDGKESPTHEGELVEEISPSRTPSHTPWVSPIHRENLPEFTKKQTVTAVFETAERPPSPESPPTQAVSLYVHVDKKDKTPPHTTTHVGSLQEEGRSASPPRIPPHHTFSASPVNQENLPELMKKQTLTSEAESSSCKSPPKHSVELHVDNKNQTPLNTTTCVGSLQEEEWKNPNSQTLEAEFISPPRATHAGSQKWKGSENEESPRTATHAGSQKWKGPENKESPTLEAGFVSPPRTSSHTATHEHTHATTQVRSLWKGKPLSLEAGLVNEILPLGIPPHTASTHMGGLQEENPEKIKSPTLEAGFISSPRMPPHTSSTSKKQTETAQHPPSHKSPPEHSIQKEKESTTLEAEISPPRIPPQTPTRVESLQEESMDRKSGFVKELIESLQEEQLSKKESSILDDESIKEIPHRTAIWETKKQTVMKMESQTEHLSPKHSGPLHVDNMDETPPHTATHHVGSLQEEDPQEAGSVTSHTHATTQVRSLWKGKPLTLEAGFVKEILPLGMPPQGLQKESPEKIKSPTLSSRMPPYTFSPVRVTNKQTVTSKMELEAEAPSSSTKHSVFLHVVDSEDHLSFHTAMDEEEWKGLDKKKSPTLDNKEISPSKTFSQTTTRVGSSQVENLDKKKSSTLVDEIVKEISPPRTSTATRVGSLLEEKIKNQDRKESSILVSEILKKISAPQTATHVGTLQEEKSKQLDKKESSTFNDEAVKEISPQYRAATHIGSLQEERLKTQDNNDESSTLDGEIIKEQSFPKTSPQTGGSSQKEKLKIQESSSSTIVREIVKVSSVTLVGSLQEGKKGSSTLDDDAATHIGSLREEKMKTQVNHDKSSTLDGEEKLRPKNPPQIVRSSQEEKTQESSASTIVREIVKVSSVTLVGSLQEENLGKKGSSTLDDEVVKEISPQYRAATHIGSLREEKMKTQDNNDDLDGEIVKEESLPKTSPQTGGSSQEEKLKTQELSSSTIVHEIVKLSSVTLVQEEKSKKLDKKGSPTLDDEIIKEISPPTQTATRVRSPQEEESKNLNKKGSYSLDCEIVKEISSPRISPRTAATQEEKSKSQNEKESSTLDGEIVKATSPPRTSPQTVESSEKLKSQEPSTFIGEVVKEISPQYRAATHIGSLREEKMKTQDNNDDLDGEIVKESLPKTSPQTGGSSQEEKLKTQESSSSTIVHEIVKLSSVTLVQEEKSKKLDKKGSPTLDDEIIKEISPPTQTATRVRSPQEEESKNLNKKESYSLDCEIVKEISSPRISPRTAATHVGSSQEEKSKSQNKKESSTLDGEIVKVTSPPRTSPQTVESSERLKSQEPSTFIGEVVKEISAPRVGSLQEKKSENLDKKESTLVGETVKMISPPKATPQTATHVRSQEEKLKSQDKKESSTGSLREEKLKKGPLQEKSKDLDKEGSSEGFTEIPHSESPSHHAAGWKWKIPNKSESMIIEIEPQNVSMTVEIERPPTQSAGWKWKSLNKEVSISFEVKQQVIHTSASLITQEEEPTVGSETESETNKSLTESGFIVKEVTPPKNPPIATHVGSLREGKQKCLDSMTLEAKQYGYVKEILPPRKRSSNSPTPTTSETELEAEHSNKSNKIP